MILEFKEVQKFTQWWLWLILIALGVLPAFALYKQVVMGEVLGDNPMPNSAIIILCVTFFGLIALFTLMRLTTTIDANGIRLKLFPFTKRSFSWNEIVTAEVITYEFVGGWGIRVRTKYGTVYNIRGNQGLAIELNNGKKLLIGTQKANELKELIAKAPKPT